MNSLKKILPLLFLLVAAVPVWAQTTDPVGGWYKPLWNFNREGSELFPEIVPDCTGDGVEDLLLRFDPESGPVSIVDGANGELWYKSEHDKGIELGWEIEDFDNDGTSDLLLRQPKFEGPLSQCGKIEVIQGGTGNLMWQAIGWENRQRLGKRLRVMELDGDGIPDVLAFRPNNHAIAFSGKTGVQLWSQYFDVGNWSRPAPDANGDGIAEIAFCGKGKLSLLDGSTGNILWSKATPIADAEATSDLQYADMNLDGILDFILIDSTWGTSGNWGAGVLETFDGRHGSPIWTYKGSREYGQVGERILLQDANGDSIPDILSVDNHLFVLIDGSDGREIWAHSVRMREFCIPITTADLSGDGFPDIVGIADYPRETVIAIDGSDGEFLWTKDSPEGHSRVQLAIAEVDGIVGLDVVISTPNANQKRGEIEAIAGFGGDTIWTVTGSMPDDELGSLMTVIPASPGFRGAILGRTSASGPNFGVYSFDLSTGILNWFLPMVLEFAFQWPEWFVEDLNMDGQPELIVVNRRLPWTAICVDTITGEVLNHIRALGGDFNYLGAISDVDGDGAKELLFSRYQFFYPSYRMETYSSLNSSYLSGLQFTSQTLSASLGGSISILVELPPQYGGVIYRCLASASGTGPTPIDFLYVPLTDDALYQRTYAGNFPPFGVIHPQGTLNARGGTRIGLQANPNQIPQAMVGRTFHLAVVLTTSTGNVYFSTGAGAISITL